ncbi:unnamed protein product, partial [Rhizoctonia solani]
MGTVNPGVNPGVSSEEVMDKPAVQASPSFATGTPEQPLGETRQIAMAPSSLISSTLQTPRILTSSQTSSFSSISTSSTAVSSTVTTTSSSTSSSIPTPTPISTPSIIPTPSPTVTSTSMVVRSSSLIAAITVLATSETPSTSFSSTTSSSTIEVITSVTIVPPPPTATTPIQVLKEKHPYALYVAFGLIMLILFGIICASIAWIIRRRRRRKEQAENQQWIGSVLDDEPDHMDVHELERGRDTVEPGVAGIGAVRRELTYPPLTPPLLSSWHFQDTPMPNHGLTTHYGTTSHAHPPWRHSSLLERSGPATDGNGLTFRQDPNGGLTFDPRGIGPTDAALYPNPHAPPTSVSAAPSHYSYGRAGPFAVTNLMPGDISSRTSETSLQTGRVPPGLENIPARSLGPLDDPSPWRRYQGTENRGGATGTEENDKSWGATIRSGIYSAVGRIVGGDEVKPEETKPVAREKDRFTELVTKRRRTQWKADSDTASLRCDEHGTDGGQVTVADSGRDSLGMDPSGDGRPVHWFQRGEH